MLSGPLHLRSSRMISFYELSVAADQDIQDIYEYAEMAYGTEQAEAYTLEIEIFLDQLIRNPEMGRKRDEIRTGLRRFPKDITSSSTKF